MSRINTNVSSLIAQTRLTRSNAQLQTSLTRLSTGLRINSGKDDPAGLIASEALRADITSVNKAITNSERANQLIATADSALGQISGLLNDIRGLVTESANSGVLSQDQIDANQLQIDSSLEAIDRIGKVTTFQGRKLLDGSLDFITNVTSGGSSISSLNIQQANLGTAGALTVNVDITSAATQGLLTNNSINFTSGVTAAGTATFNTTTTPAVQASGTVSLTNTAGSITVNAVAGGAADGIVGNTTDVVLQTSAGAAASSGTLTLTNTAGSIALTAANAGASTNGLTVVLQTGGSTAAAYNSGTNTLTVDVAAGDTIADINTAIGAEGTFTGVATNGANVYNAADNATVNTVTAGGSNGTTGATYNTGTNTITVSAAVGATVTQLATAINSLTDFNASAASGGGNTYDAADNATTTDPLSGGTAAVIAANVIGITSNATGTAFNGTLTVNTSGSQTAGTVGVAITGGNITVTLNNSDNLTVTQLVAGIQSGLTTAGGDYTVALNSGTGTNSFATATDTESTTALSGGTNDGGTGLGADLVFKLSGTEGSEVLNFSSGSSLTQIISAINLVQDSTGVQASNNAGVLELTSTRYGSSAFVAADVISEGTGGTFATSLSATRDAGTDIVATVNGVEALGNGNSISVNNSTLNLNLTVSSGSTTDVTFNINGGGAVFQLGPDVVTAQQARIGIGSVNTGELGGVSGRLYELRSGNSKSLSNDSTGAANVVDEVITKVNSLRGRLGAFQRTTLETNIASLTDTLANLTEAQSAIRDADFASESASLTRSQILVQSGTAVLQIANQNPQQVLSLLRG